MVRVEYFIDTDVFGELPIPASKYIDHDTAVSYVLSAYANSGQVKLIRREYKDWQDTEYLIDTEYREDERD